MIGNALHNDAKVGSNKLSMPIYNYEATDLPYAPGPGLDSISISLGVEIEVGIIALPINLLCVVKSVIY